MARKLLTVVSKSYRKFESFLKSKGYEIIPNVDGEYKKKDPLGTYVLYVYLTDVSDEYDIYIGKATEKANHNIAGIKSKIKEEMKAITKSPAITKEFRGQKTVFCGITPSDLKGAIKTGSSVAIAKDLKMIYNSSKAYMNSLDKSKSSDDKVSYILMMEGVKNEFTLTRGDSVKILGVYLRDVPKKEVNSEGYKEYTILVELLSHID